MSWANGVGELASLMRAYQRQRRQAIQCGLAREDPVAKLRRRRETCALSQYVCVLARNAEIVAVEPEAASPTGAVTCLRCV